MPGLLDNVRQKIGGLLSEAASVRELFSGRVGGQTLEQGIQNRMQPNSLRPALSPQQMVEAGLNIAGVAPVGMTVWHGSPHKFDKFDMSKIGTGEGAQAYGHGLYMAESPDVAKSYADELGQLEILHNNKVVGVFDKDPAANAAHQIRATGGDVDKAIKRAQNIYTGAWRDNVVNEIKKLGPGEVSERVNGSMYKVDIPDEAVARMLDWDKPLSEQAPEVQKALKSNPNYEKYWLEHLERRANARGENPTAQDLYRYLGDDYNKQEITDILRSQGIPGIRYLDGGSRSAGEGTSNFVLFDDKLPRILERNGVPTGLQPWLPGEWGGL